MKSGVLMYMINQGNVDSRDLGAHPEHEFGVNEISSA